jgi:outer membrane protein assembly factor BamB
MGDMFFVGTYANEVMGLDRKAKKIAWRYEHPTRKFPFYSSAAVVDNRVVLGGRDKLVHCFDAKTGKSIWQFTTRARVESSPAVSAGRVYIGSNDGRLYVLGLAKGEKLFEFEAGGPVSASPALANGKVLIATQDGKILCLG